MKTLLGHLEADYCSPQFKCPYCLAGLSVQWDTEYSDPLHGESVAPCPQCNKEIQISVEIKTTYSAIKVE